MRCSIVIPTYNKAALLQRTLERVRSQKIPFEHELIVVDDGSQDDTHGVCEFYGVDYAYLDRPFICGPAAAKNAGYRKARGEVVLCMNDDILLMGDDAVARMCNLKARTYNVAYEDHMTEDGGIDCGHSARLPLFYCAAVTRKHLWAVGGCDERFTMLNCEDTFLSECLRHRLGVRPVFLEDVHARHQWHDRPAEHWSGEAYESALRLYRRLCVAASESGNWVAQGGPWTDKERDS